MTSGNTSPTRTQPRDAVSWRVGRNFGSWHLRVGTRTACGIDLSGIRGNWVSLACFANTIKDHRCQTCLDAARKHLELIR